MKQLRRQLATAERKLNSANANGESLKLSEGYQGSELYELLTGGYSAAAGVAVNERSAMTVSAVYACVDKIAGTISTLPFNVYESDEDGFKSRVQHIYSELLNMEASPMWASDNFIEFLLTDKLLNGDGHAVIDRNGAGVAQGLYPVPKRIVTPVKIGGRVVYGIFPDDEEPFAVDQDDMIHLSGVGFDGLRSLSPIRNAARESIGLNIAAARHGGAFFSNGARPDFALTTDKKLDPTQVEVLRTTWQQKHSGVGNAHLPAVLTGGLDVKELTMNADDAQLLGTLQYSITDIARVFGVPPWMIGETEKQTSWGSGIEQTGIGFVRYTLRRHITGLEREFNRKLFRRDTASPEMSVEGLLRGASKERGEFYRAALGGSGGPGWMTQNEVRRLENRGRIDGGDELTQWKQSDAKGDKNEPNE